MPHTATHHIDCKRTFIVSVLVLLLRATKRSGRILSRGRHAFRDSTLALAQTNLLPSSRLLNMILERKMATQRLLRPGSSPATSFAAHLILIKVIVEAHADPCGLRITFCMEGRKCTHLVDPLTRPCSFLDSRSWYCKANVLRRKTICLCGQADSGGYLAHCTLGKIESGLVPSKLSSKCFY